MKLVLSTLLALSLQGAAIQATFDTSGLPAGNYELDLQLIDGDGVVNNTASFQHFLLTGIVLNALTFTGTASGSTATSIVITDADPAPDLFSSALQNFTIGGGLSSIAFVLMFSESFAGGFPDAIFIGILDSTFATLASLMLDLADPTVLTPTSGNGITVTAGEYVPEPSLGWLVALGGVAIASLSKRRQR
jgi:hypothetical protein